jgi:hypothetical protein
VDVLAFIATLVQALAWPVVVVILALILRRQLRAMVAQLAERMKALKTLKAPGTAFEFEDDLIDVKDKIARLAKVSEKDHITGSDLFSGADDLIPPAPGEDRFRDVQSPDQDGYPDQDDGYLYGYPDPDEIPDPAGYSDQRGYPEARRYRQPRGYRRPAIPDEVMIADSDSKVFLLTQTITRDNLAALAENSPEATVIAAWVIVERSIRRIAQRLNIDVKENSFAWLALTALNTLEDRGAFAESANVWSIMQKLNSLRDAVASGAKITKLEAYDYASTALQLAKILTDAYSKMIRQENEQSK